MSKLVEKSLGCFLNLKDGEIILHENLTITSKRIGIIGNSEKEIYQKLKKIIKYFNPKYHTIENPIKGSKDSTKGLENNYALTTELFIGGLTA